ncbi:MAG TPA: iron-containing alcohol dehydrogenase [Bryobacteraceae bacterium]|nr:iron-containing alcohol dehydrogenase [Bryobacteraceae bacterium]
MRVNIAALRSAGVQAALDRYAEVARVLSGHESARPEDGATWVEQLCRDLEIPPLRAYGVRLADAPALAEKAAAANSMKANPIGLRRDQLEELIARAL